MGLSSVESTAVNATWLVQGKDGDAESAGRERQSARAAQARLRDGGSDALSALNALLAYEAAANPAQFCMYAS